MKKRIVLIILLLIAASTEAQLKYTRKTSASNKEMQHWCIDINGYDGKSFQNLIPANSITNYTNALNPSIGKPLFSNGTTIGIDANVGYFFGKRKNFGVGVGFMYLQQKGDVTQDSFHIEYQSQDFQKKIFRQVLTATSPIKESLKTRSYNIPLVIRYRKKLLNWFGVAADIGIVCNLKQENHYTTNASFNYEAIYQYLRDANGNYVAVYDNSSIPSITNDWFITQSQYQVNNPTGMTSAFDSLRKLGYNVGLNVKPIKSNGAVSYTKISVSYIFHPELCFYISRKVSIDIGGYYSYQRFNNSVNNTYRVTDKVGDYNSLLKNIATSVNQSYGITSGIRYYFGKKDKVVKADMNKSLQAKKRK